MRHINIPVFIPHLGCPNQCVFCNQRRISGVKEFSLDEVMEIIETGLSTVGDDDEVEIAFFGGSFTGIDRDLMVELLEIAHSYIERGAVRSIRCSTRPDYINGEILDLLKKYGVKTIELGLQSSSDKVLEITKRGHYFEAEEKACRLIVEQGFDLVGQMMIGLPSADIESEIATAEFIASVGAVGARIYPTVVFRDTELCDMTLNGYYEPLTAEEAVKRSAKVLEIFISRGVEVIRIGLQASEGLSSTDSYLAGPNHAALGEMVIGEVYYNRIMKKLSDIDPSDDQNITVLVSVGALSKAIGQKRRNKLRLMGRYKNISFAESTDIPEYEVSVNITGEMICT